MREERQLSHEGLRVADLVRSGRDQAVAVERAPGIFESRGIGNSHLVTTEEGSVLVNTGTLRDAKRARTLFRAASDAPIRKVVLTQSHANQYGGLELYAGPDCEVIAQRRHVDERRHATMLFDHYRRGSRRFFANITGSSDDLLPTREILPDRLIEDRHDFALGGRRFELYSTPGGETRSALIVWLPAERIAIVGNLLGPLFGNQPNLNTLRGDKPRRALEFVGSVRRLRDLGPTLILTGHQAISGADALARELTRISDAVEWIHDRTVDGMNEGMELHALMREVQPPPDLALTEEYGRTAWNVRSIWHEYNGWFDPSRGTTELYDMRPEHVAPALAELAGGADRIAERARGFVAEGRPLEALHLLDVALGAEPASMLAREVRIAALEQLLEKGGRDNLWERMWIASELRAIGGGEEA